MFEVPDWETDIPETSEVFTKKLSVKAKKNQFNSKVKESTSKGDKNLGHDSNPNVSNNKASIKRKKPGKPQNPAASKYQNEDISLEIDELLVNAKKKKLNDIYKKEDCEELLFGDTKESKLIDKDSSKTVKQKFKPYQINGNNQSNPNKSPKKRKLSVNDSNKEINNIIANAKKIKLNDKELATKNKITKNSQNEKNNGNKKLETKSNIVNKTTDVNELKVTEQSVKLNNSKKEKIKKVLEQNNRSSIKITGNKLRERMLEKLKAAQFRYLNEKLYTSSGDEAQQIFQTDPAAFKTYHQGYQLQVRKWPVNPLDVIVKRIQKMPKSFIIADMGCGEAALSKRVPHKVHSFDLVSAAPTVVACDMARTPLLKGSVDVVVYCLALMGTELTRYLVEANRVLKTGGHLLIAEVESRFEDVNTFAKEVERLGFRLKDLNNQHSVFFFLQFVKNQEPPVKKNKLPVLTLKPCLYKRR